jgi:hypothetical protein
MWNQSTTCCIGRIRAHPRRSSVFLRTLILISVLPQLDDQKVKDYGVSLAVDMIRRITSEGDIRGVHLCTLNLERSVQLVLEKLHWAAGGSPKVQNKLITVCTASLVRFFTLNPGMSHTFRMPRVKPYILRNQTQICTLHRQVLQIRQQLG